MVKKMITNNPYTKVEQSLEHGILAYSYAGKYLGVSLGVDMHKNPKAYHIGIVMHELFSTRREEEGALYERLLFDDEFLVDSSYVGCLLEDFLAELSEEHTLNVSLLGLIFGVMAKKAQYNTKKIEILYAGVCFSLEQKMAAMLKGAGYDEPMVDTRDDALELSCGLFERAVVQVLEKRGV